MHRWFCPEKPCLCCVCALRDSAEFGDAFSPDDECCIACHDDMSAPGWPGMRCGSVATPTAEDDGRARVDVTETDRDEEAS